jgi:hypothetical protein
VDGRAQQRSLHMGQTIFHAQGLGDTVSGTWDIRRRLLGKTDANSCMDQGSSNAFTGAEAAVRSMRERLPRECHQWRK